MASEKTNWDVIVAGAGPGGSSAATLLAEAGARVLVLEKEAFPRFHIGESLLPAASLVTELLGVEADPNVFLYKAGAQFVCEASGRIQSFDFSEALPGPQRYAWHVDRARFDTLIRDRAIEAGATVRHGEVVSAVEFHPDHVAARIETEASGEAKNGSGDANPTRIETARYFIDASGQDRLLARHFGSGRAYERFGKAAAFTHFSGLSESARAELLPNNDIRIVVIEDGWLWGIPLTGNRLSIGLVSRKSGLRRERLDEYLASSPLFGRLTQGAERGPTRLIGNFSFRNERASGARFACVGDSACFIDPVFSSGVSLAILRAAAVAERLAPALEAGEEARADLMGEVEATMARAYETFASLVYRFYNTRFVDHLIFGAPAEGDMRAGVISVLTGDVLRDDNPFQDLLLGARRSRARALEASEGPAEPVVWMG